MPPACACVLSAQARRIMLRFCYANFPTTRNISPSFAHLLRLCRSGMAAYFLGYSYPRLRLGRASAQNARRSTHQHDLARVRHQHDRRYMAARHRARLGLAVCSVCGCGVVRRAYTQMARHCTQNWWRLSHSAVFDVLERTFSECRDVYRTHLTMGSTVFTRLRYFPTKKYGTVSFMGKNCDCAHFYRAWFVRIWLLSRSRQFCGNDGRDISPF